MVGGKENACCAQRLKGHGQPAEVPSITASAAINNAHPRAVGFDEHNVRMLAICTAASLRVSNSGLRLPMEAKRGHPDMN